MVFLSFSSPLWMFGVRRSPPLWMFFLPFLPPLLGYHAPGFTLKKKRKNPKRRRPPHSK
jgi:hypothetical protein